MTDGTEGTNSNAGRTVLLVTAGLVAGLAVGGVGGFLVGHATEGISIGSGNGTFSTPTDPKAPSVSSARDRPVALGTAVDLGNGWRLKVNSFDESPSLDDQEPPTGRQFVSVNLSATYVDGDKDATSPFFGMDISLVGPTGVASTTSDGNCFAPDPSFDNLGDVYKGGTATGNMCIAVPDADLGGLVLVAAPSMSFDAAKTYFALR
ncbi:MAG: hypothetical protein U0Q22_09020 [Acidimicrobiales bacterium]